MKLKDWWQKHQRQIVFSGGGLLFGLLIVVIIKLTFFQPVDSSRANPDEIELLSQFSSEQEEAEVSVIAFADIKGAVVSPGMYEINENTRLQDLISLAGGLTPEAESRYLNFSLLIQDQMMVYVPFQGEDYSGEENHLVGGNQAAAENKSSGVNLNTADLSELQTLNGIGPKKAEAIIAYREEVGSFKKIEDLMEVGGIGEKTFENLKEEITVK